MLLIQSIIKEVCILRQFASSLIACSNFKIKESFISCSEMKKIEKKWKDSVTEYHDCKIKLKKPKKYVLSMFPYPSGSLHMGHVRVYTISDVMSRVYQMMGYNVLHPMGWDAFGLPAENAAIEKAENPESWTRANIAKMKKQLLNLGCQFDWSREYSTCDPDYYKWTQYIFLKLYQANLVYRQEAFVNWDPVDLTVLANEQIDENGRSWRSGALVEKKLLTQWFIKSTRFSEELYNDLEDPILLNWRDIPLLQRGWIGECDGYRVHMNINDFRTKSTSASPIISIWLKDLSHLNKLAFISVKSDHILNKKSYYQQSIDDITLLNIKAINPANNCLVPIFVSDKLECSFGSDTYLGFPSENKSDESTCIKFNIELNRTDKDGQNVSEMNTEDLIQKLVNRNGCAYKSSTRLKDWLISRQRFWGAPIPIIYCDSCGMVPVPEDDLPVKLPVFDGNIKKGMSPLKDISDWRQCSCPKCGAVATRETDTMDTFVDSSWYFLRFLDPRNPGSICDLEREAAFMPVDLYVGGKEHAILHLYFARFMQKCLRQLGLASHKEPFAELLVQGMVKAKTYQVKASGKYLRREEVDFNASPPVEKGTNNPLLITDEKMSKSKYNGVDPQELIDKNGVDALRLAILMKVGPHSERNWDENDLQDAYQILGKIWKLVTRFVDYQNKDALSNSSVITSEIEKHDTFLFETRNQLLLRASNYILNSKQFHSAIRCIQQLCSTLQKVPLEIGHSEEYEKSLRCILLLLAPMCPHFCSEAWSRINQVSGIKCRGNDWNILTSEWPKADPTYKMEVEYKVNEEEVLTMRLCQKEYQKLTEEEAVQMGRDNDEISSRISNSPILNVKFTYNPNYKANVSIYTKSPEEIRQTKSAKKKKRKNIL